MPKHPFVSESHEGRPAFEWAVALVTLLSVLLAVLGYAMEATALLAVTSIVCGVLRPAMRDRSPWKVRSVGFDAAIGILFGLGLLLVFLSIQIVP